MRWTDLERRRKRLRLAGFNYADTNSVYFITICARNLTSPFADPILGKEIIGSLLRRRSEEHIALYAYCLMPDHLHLALSPKSPGRSVPRIVDGFKSFTTRLSWRHGITGKLWQRSYYDHVARSCEDTSEICKYILANPVRKGLVEAPEEWPFSGQPDELL